MRNIFREGWLGAMALCVALMSPAYAQSGSGVTPTGSVPPQNGIVTGPLGQDFYAGGNNVMQTRKGGVNIANMPSFNGAPIDGATVNGRTLTEHADDMPNALDYGVKGDGVTDDGPAIQALLNKMSALGGRHILFPATGHAYLIKTGFSLSSPSASGNVIVGSSGGLQWPGPYNNDRDAWTQTGTWFDCEDSGNSCITMGGNASGLENINIWQDQPTPPASEGCGVFCNMTHNWTPANMPFVITVNQTQNFNYLRNLHIINATNCLDFEGQESGVNNIFTSVEHAYLGCFNTGTKFRRVDNVIDLHDIHYNLWWYPFSSDVIGYTEGDTTSVGHKVDWDAAYLTNLQATGIEFYQSYKAIKVADDTVVSGLGSVTIGGQAWQLANLQFNQVCNAITLAASDTHFNGTLVNVELNIDPQTSNKTQCSAIDNAAFDLASKNVQLTIGALQVLYADTIAKIGNGTDDGGVVFINGVSANNYSAFNDNQPAFVNAGGQFDIPQGLNWLFSQNTNAGPHMTGTGGITTNGGSNIEGLAGTPRKLNFSTAPADGSNFDATRWSVLASQDAENGSNSGSNFQLMRFADDGSYLGVALNVNRASGLVAFPSGIQPTLPTSCSGQPDGTLVNNGGVVATCPVNFVTTLPTSCAGVASGSLWNNGSVVNICP